MRGLPAVAYRRAVSSAGNLPHVFAFVLTAAFVLPRATFRSIGIPVEAMLVNLLSVGAASGVPTGRHRSS